MAKYSRFWYNVFFFIYFTMFVEVVYTETFKQLKIPVNVPNGCTLKEAVLLSNIEKEIDLSNLEFGIFGEIKPDNYILKNNDRIEIYRPLKIDPKEARRQRI